ncbi:MAG: hypothetical protein WBC71_09300 [Salaquimonas sp.]
MKRILAKAFGRLAPLAVLSMLTACQTSSEALDVDEIKKANLVEQECAVYFAVLAKMQNEGRTARGNLTEGCPSSAQGIQASISPTNPPRLLDSRFDRIIYQRMIARGMPEDLADQVRTSQSFYNLVELSDQVYGT